MKKLKVLVADNQVVVRQQLLQELRKDEYIEIVGAVDNGKDAYEFLEFSATRGDIADYVQLIVTDIEMPQMDGHHFTKKVKDHPGLAKLPIVIFSSLITDDLRHKGEQVGAVEQITKPEIAELINKIDQHIL